VASSGLPPEVTTALVKGLSTDPAGRQSSIRSWASALQRGFDGPPDRPQPDQRPRHHGRSAPPLIVAAIACAIVALFLSVGIYAALNTDRDDRTRSQLLADGQIEWVQERDDARLLVVGPGTLTVNQSARFVGSADPETDIVWLGPGGATAASKDIVVTPRGPGTLRLHAVAQSPEGNPVVVSIDVDVTS